ncbi:hypothetical protein N7462_006795 [Penicillium macrosclerotiorum]|uniref:uncharacterized protein n=1 Tax=Penicillium macrosclerotiorum TaxID=303699 RepID=UPI002546A432|nr:uncharacterized protein N7462_006795 [Penicillium macrosclerotiorum]KAJ5683630.1 hypothetical protein N7462_006795 [Penicillium macrosclerotiorum]
MSRRQGHNRLMAEDPPGLREPGQAPCIVMEYEVLVDRLLLHAPDASDTTQQVGTGDGASLFPDAVCVQLPSRFYPRCRQPRRDSKIATPCLDGLILFRVEEVHTEAL